MPAYDELIFIANNEKLDDPRLPRFFDAIEAGTLYLLNRPDESFSLFIEGRAELDDELNRHAFADTLRRFALRPATLDTARYDRFAAFLEQQGLIKSPPPVADYASRSGGRPPRPRRGVSEPAATLQGTPRAISQQIERR